MVMTSVCRRALRCAGASLLAGGGGSPNSRWTTRAIATSVARGRGPRKTCP